MGTGINIYDMCFNAVLDEKIITDAAIEPVDIDTFKIWAKIDYNEDDIIITPLIKSARRLLERKYNIGIIEKDYYAVVNNSCGMIDIPGAPIGIISTTGVTVVGSDNKFLKSPCNCEVVLEYKSGYPLQEVPNELKTAIMQQTLYMYENRGDVTTDPTNISPQAQSIMNVYSRNTNGMFL